MVLNYIFNAMQIFTDAGQYVIRFGSSDPSSKTSPAAVVEYHICKKNKCHLTYFSFLFVLSSLQIQDLEIARPLTLSERAVTVALAISLDNDYFSRHGGL